MNRKKATSLIALLLVLLMVVSLVASVIPATAHAVSWDDINEMQSQKNQLNNRVQECQERVSQLKDQQANVLEQKAAWDEQNRLANEQLDLVAEEIAVYDQLIEDKAKELEKAKNREAEQLRRYRARVRAMEESGGYNILALIINSGSFGEFLTAMDDMGEIMESDKALEKQYVAAREETEDIKAEYEAERAEYEGKQDELREEQAELEKLIEDAYAELDSLEEEIDKAIKEYEAAEAAEEAAAATIYSLIQQMYEENRQNAANNQGGGSNAGNSGGESSGGESSGGESSGGGSSGGSNTGGGNGTLGGGIATGTGSFAWPVPCSTRVTSRYGLRIDPFTGKEAGHAGIDIDGFGHAGDIVVASDGGKVAVASSDAGYGNYIIIDHGDRQTVYAHLSGFAVSYGDWVEQGQTIGYLGETGRATGVHLHFEIYVNGGRVDPASYFTGLSYWNC